MAARHDTVRHGFSGSSACSGLTLAECFADVRDGGCIAHVIDLVPLADRLAWWEDAGFPDTPVQEHNHAPLAIASPTLGPLQRAADDAFPAKYASYFAYAKLANRDLRSTRFVRLFVDELDAEAYPVGEWAELLMATRRRFTPNLELEYSFEPHVDAVSFGRDPARWPITTDYEQVSALLTLKTAENRPGIVIWNSRPDSRVTLNAWISEYRETGAIGALEGVERATVTPADGQLMIFASRLLHAVEACMTERWTLGTFLVWEDGWKLCH